MKESRTPPSPGDALKPFPRFVSKALLRDYFIYDYFVEKLVIQYWVEDIGFVADTLGELRTPVAGFSQATDASGFEAFGMSKGGAAATKFCKLDSRCRAAANLDHTVRPPLGKPRPCRS